jgi:hypothetical protein
LPPKVISASKAAKTLFRIRSSPNPAMASTGYNFA